MMWKYRTLHLTKPISESQLKRMGEEGWELAGCTQVAVETTKSAPTGPTTSVSIGVTLNKYLYYFKLPRETSVYGGPR